MTTNWWELPDDDDPQPWTLADIYNDLGTLDDVAEAMNFKKRRVEMWVERQERIKCPDPIRRIGNVRVYSIQEWRDWYANWTKNRKPGTKWTDGAGSYDPPKHKAYGNQGLSELIRAAADRDRTD